MVELRAAKIAGIADDIGEPTWTTPTAATSWCWAGGARYGAIAGGRQAGPPPRRRVACAHLRHLNPLPPNIGELLALLREGVDPREEQRPALEDLRAEFLVDAIGFNKVEGRPIFAEELDEVINAHL